MEETPALPIIRDILFYTLFWFLLWFAGGILAVYWRDFDVSYQTTLVFLLIIVCRSSARLLRKTPKGTS